jgi:hypothetical protein
MGDTFWQERIAAIKVLIVIYEDALSAIALNPIQMYKMDTGQSVQTVNYLNLTELNNSYDKLLNRLATYEARCTGSGTTHATPTW